MINTNTGIFNGVLHKLITLQVTKAAITMKNDNEMVEGWRDKAKWIQTHRQSRKHREGDRQTRRHRKGDRDEKKEWDERLAKVVEEK
ncbi:hypothetical protein E2C01_065523 [Portunus trituberculatus]|uniref:Uncharacterized protein n=1 Tax=Portunus trituberculatus TaxID=210409 RepID=A0A5B7HET8_PORTR|nr:hypothetical protein [Portunus trituberculatus]